MLRLALEIGAKIESGEVSRQDIDAAIRSLTLSGLESRAQHMARYLGECDAGANKAALTAMLEKLAHDEGGVLLPFEEFKARAERVYYGVVFTAHPTFTMTRALTRKLAEHAAALGGGKAYKADKDELKQAAAEPFRTPDLPEENAFALEGLGHAQSAVRIMHEALLDAGRKYYPRQWTALRPRLATMASWVGFDLDGRKDIGWQTSFAMRMLIQILQLKNYQSRIADISSRHPSQSAKLASLADAAGATAADLQRHHEFFSAYDDKADPEQKKLQQQSKILVAGGDNRIMHPDRLAGPLEEILAQTDDENLQKKLVLLLSELKNNGLSAAQMHVRLKASQLHNALVEHIELQYHPNRSDKRHFYLNKVKALVAEANPCRINFGDIQKTKATALRQFMLLQQVVKHVDSHSPIRFLIAETESAYTVLSAFYLAKRFGVEDHIDICPLFETSDALEHGSKFYETLLDDPGFLDYVRKRGNLCIQTGYSDAGRYIGPGPATGSIERLKERIVKLLEARGLTDIDLLFFDTHGESIGRGCHPESMEQRMQYICPPHVRAMAAERGIRYRQESSFQGGDGFAWFMNGETALAVLTRIMGYWLDAPSEAHDPYYDNKDRVNDFFNTVLEAQEDLMKDPKYGVLLNAFGANLMYDTGSRPRNREGSKPGSQPAEAKKLRAVPQNGILEQLGLLANTVTGLGEAIRTNQEFFDEMMETSPRFRTIFALVLRGMQLSDPLIMKAYIDILDPQGWQLRAYKTEGRLAQKFNAVAQQLGRMNLHAPMKELFGRMLGDYALLRDAIQPQEYGASDISPELAYLHALRLALINHVFLTATEIPRFSSGNDVTREDILTQVLRLNAEGAVNDLREIFQVQQPSAGNADYGEVSDYRPSGEGGYAALHRRLLEPLMATGDRIKQISTAVAHHCRFIG